MSELKDVIARGYELLALSAPRPWHWVNPEDDSARKSGEWRADLRTVSEHVPTSFGGEALPEWILCVEELRGDSEARLEAHADIVPFAVNVLERLLLVAAAFVKVQDRMAAFDQGEFPAGGDFKDELYAISDDVRGVGRDSGQ